MLIKSLPPLANPVKFDRNKTLNQEIFPNTIKTVRFKH